MVRLANALASGTPGVRPEIAERLVSRTQRGRAPARAHARLARPGRPPRDGRPGARALRRRRAARRRRRSRSSTRTRFSTGIAALAVADAERLLEAHGRRGGARPRGVRRQPDAAPPGDRRGAAVPGPRGVARPPARRCWRAARSGSPAPRGTSRTRSPSAGLPQLHGALRDALAFARGQLEIELNASQENPLLVPDEDRIVSVANFDDPAARRRRSTSSASRSPRP